jgi:hypothetical protein
MVMMGVNEKHPFAKKSSETALHIDIFETIEVVTSKLVDRDHQHQVSGLFLRSEDAAEQQWNQ